MRSPSSPHVEARRQFLLLAPAGGEAPRCFADVMVDGQRSSELLAEMQKFRGAIYLQEGAITTGQLCEDGRHRLADDQESWHLLVLGDGHRILGCMRYRTFDHCVPAPELGVLSSEIAKSSLWRMPLRRAIESEIARARFEGISFGEAGGWALAEELRCSTEALRMVLATYSLAQVLGHSIVVSTATLRNSSTPILCRIGGRPIVAAGAEVPPYFDPQYQCHMQIVRFDSRAPNPRYAQWVAQLRSSLLRSPVLCDGADVGFRSTSNLAKTVPFGRKYAVKSAR